MGMQSSFKTFNPIKNQYNSQLYHVSSVQEIEKSLEQASEACAVLSSKSYPEIASFLKEIKTQLSALKMAVKKVYIEESGLNEDRFEIEFGRTLYQLDHFAEYIVSDSWKNFCTQEERLQDKQLIKTKCPLGPILVMGASNFPLAYSTIGGDSVAALAAKCPVIVKAHPYHAGTSLTVFKAVQKAIEVSGLPSGTFAHIVDDGYKAASYLAKHKAIKGIGFTGSIEGGNSMVQHANSRKSPIPVFAEMGSVNPVFILDDIPENDLEATATKLVHSVCNDRGQFCTKPGILFIKNTARGKRLVETIKDQIVAFDDGPMLHPDLKAQFESKITEIQNLSGESEFYQGNRRKEFFVKNSVLVADEDIYRQHSILQKEIFGPFCTIVQYESLEHLSTYLSNLEGQLTCSIFHADSKNNEDKELLLNLAIQKAGRIILNDVPTGVTVSKAMHHGGPYPASSDSRFTAVGSDSIKRFLRDVTIQEKCI